MPKIILASQSAQRRKIIETLELPVQVQPADIDEQAITFRSPRDKAKKVALAKALKVAQSFPDAYVVAGDTFCYCRGKILEKPKTLKEAEEMLAWQSGRNIDVLTGYAFYHQKTKAVSNSVVLTRIQMRKLSSSEIHHYCQTEPVLTWSAAFSPAYDSGMALIKEIRGNATGFSHGIPLDRLVDFLRKEKVLSL